MHRSKTPNIILLSVIISYGCWADAILDSILWRGGRFATTTQITVQSPDLDSFFRLFFLYLGNYLIDCITADP
jgi:hypothetical protein